MAINLVSSTQIARVISRNTALQNALHSSARSKHGHMHKHDWPGHCSRPPRKRAHPANADECRGNLALCAFGEQTHTRKHRSTRRRTRNATYGRTDTETPYVHPNAHRNTNLLYSSKNIHTLLHRNSYRNTNPLHASKCIHKLTHIHTETQTPWIHPNVYIHLHSQKFTRKCTQRDTSVHFQWHVLNEVANLTSSTRQQSIKLEWTAWQRNPSFLAAVSPPSRALFAL